VIPLERQRTTLTLRGVGKEPGIFWAFIRGDMYFSVQIPKRKSFLNYLKNEVYVAGDEVRGQC
jgi:hypothetical protein